MRREDIQRLVAGATEDLVSALEAGKSESLTRYLAAMGRFHDYSLGNAILIALQRPSATHVAGYRAWQRLGRQVRKTERGIAIMAPILRRADDDSEEDKVVAFKAAHVWDIEQTDGRPLPEFAKVEGNPSIHLEQLKAHITGQGIDLAYSDSLGSAYGLSCGGKILIRPGLGPAEEFSVLVHELSHEMIHKQGQTEQKTSRKVREVEAEAVAFVVSQACGLDCGTAASDYIQLYDNGGKETLLASLERIHRTAREIIKAVTASEGGGAETASREASAGTTAVAA